MKTAICVICAAALAIVCLPGCETSHTETTKENMLGGQTHQETTVTRNPVTGNTSVESSKTVTH